jgi:hypothetical protein
LPISKKRYILLVQVGKEGWDCPSLTGVILSQKGDSPQNMVLANFLQMFTPSGQKQRRNRFDLAE